MLAVAFFVIMFVMAIYSTKKLVDDIIITFDGGNNFGGGIFMGLLVLCWCVAISYLAFYHVFPWWDSL